MADDNIVRSYRSIDPTRRAGAPAPSRDNVDGSDPLAELARLIGQSDPFADLERTSGRSGEARQRVDAPPSDWRQTAAALARESMTREPPAADPHFEEVDQAIAAAKSLRPAHDDRFARPADHASYAPHDAAFGQAADAHGSYADGPYDDEPRAGDQFNAHDDDRQRDPHAAGTQHGGQESENYFFDGAAAPADERFYDDPPRARATNGLITAVVLIGCGILGTAGAYGYRTYYSGIRVADAPIIPAEKSPNKVVPPPAGGDAQASKSVERVGPSNERVVPRQEEPVAIPDPNGPRAVLPAPFTTSPGPGPSVQANNAAVAEPKKVHTVAIRPDGGDPMARPVGGAGLPLQTGPSSPPPPVATTRAPANPPAPKPASPPARASGGPLSLEPGQADPASAYQAPRVTTSGAAPAGAAPANGPRLASAAPAGSAASGGYVVQISSQRSEADAQASFRSLQSKFPRELGEREAIVRRADLGPKGVYYRAMVGPFGTAGDADQFCGDLKAAGGQCIVQKN
jgi:hypothetical protein